MKKLSILLFMLVSMGCAHCRQQDQPNIRTQPGIEYCGQMCSLLKSKDCKPYYEDVPTEDGGTMTCQAFCEYELKNSVPLNPKCLVENLKDCSQIETICR